MKNKHLIPIMIVSSNNSTQFGNYFKEVGNWRLTGNHCDLTSASSLEWWYYFTLSTSSENNLAKNI